MNDLPKVFSALCVAVRQAGIVAKAFQGKVQNDGKSLEDRSDIQSDRTKAQLAAKTIIDETVQEIILLAAKEILDPAKVMLDTEENTPLVSFFPSEGKDSTLVMDPIDGTLEYLEGRDDYTICVCLIERGEMKLAIVFFPSRDMAYAIAPDVKSYQYANFSIDGTTQAKAIDLPKSAEKILYKNSRVPEGVVTALQSDGYTVIDDSENQIAPPQAFLKMLDGTSAGFLCDNRQIRDILVGAIIGNATGGFTSDWEGKEIVWPSGSRVPRIIFGNAEHKDEILKLIG